MIGYIANTDQGWFDFLRQQPAQEEVNFWNPSGRNVFRGKIGSPFIFRLKAPVNMIGGFGLVSWADRMPEWLAWECFGRGNGASTLDGLRSQIQRLRQRSDIQAGPALDQIGCIILSQPVFLPPDLWIPAANRLEEGESAVRRVQPHDRRRASRLAGLHGARRNAGGSRRSSARMCRWPASDSVVPLSFGRALDRAYFVWP